MTVINSFFTSAYARQYATQLFTKSDVGTGAPSSNFNRTASSQDYDGYSSASARALARISEILNGLNSEDNASADQPDVDESNGYITTARGTSSADELTFKSVGLYNVDAGDGDDTLTVKSGAISNLEAGAGSDKLNLASKTAMDVSGGEGDDVINYSGSFAMNFDGGSGDDTMRINARTIMGLTGGDGNDTIDATGERISIAGGKGDDTIKIVNEGDRAAEYNYARGDGRDTISTDGPISISFSHGYTAQDLTVTTEGNTLTVTGADGDAIHLTLTNGQDVNDYSLGVKDGVLTLRAG